MIIAKTTMEYLPTSCKTCDIHLESEFSEFKGSLGCPILREWLTLEEQKFTKKFRNCPLEKR